MSRPDPRAWLAVAVAVAFAASTACSAISGASATRAQAELVVFAAASLRAALGRAAAAYEAANPDTAVTLSTDSSAALATQIEQGAPADVFLSADTANAQRLVDGGHASGPVVPFATNRLTVIVPAGNPGRVASPADLARDGVTVIAAGDEVPLTGYAAQLLANLARQPGYPDHFERRYAANVASKEDNVAAAVARIELGEGDAAIVYETDAKRSTRVESVPVPQADAVRATYGGVVVGGSSEPERAAAFLSWLAGPDGQAVLAEFGFLPPA